MKKYRIGLVGVGAVGAEMVKTIRRRGFPCASLDIFAAHPRCETIDGEKFQVRAAGEDAFKGLDIVLFAGGTAASIALKDAVVSAGAVMIDNSRAFRMDPSVPLVVPQVNPEDLDSHRGVIANPNCTTAIMLEAVAPLHKAKTLKRIVASTYQAASGAGAAGMAELEEQMKAMAEGREPEVKAFRYRLCGNIIPQIDSFDATSGYTLEELKMTNETRKILHAPQLAVSCTCVRIPVPRAHSESLNLEFENEIAPQEAREILSRAEGVRVADDPEAGVYPMPMDATGRYEVLAGRIRRDLSRNDGRGLEMFVSGDQLLRGAALNAVEIAETLVKRNLI